MTARLDKRGKAFLIAFGMVLALVVAERKASADEWDWLRIACAPWAKNSIPWDLLGCWQLPDPNSPAA